MFYFSVHARYSRVHDHVDDPRGDDGAGLLGHQLVVLVESCVHACGIELHLLFGGRLLVRF